MKKLLPLFLLICLTSFANSQCTKLLDFAGTTNGNYPMGSLISDGTFLYGMTYGGGINSEGTIFKIKPDGSGYVKLLDFAGTANGAGPEGALISDGTFLYGMTSGGGTNGNGTVFKIKPDGSGYVKLLDFAGTTNGSLPEGSLIFDGTFLYGMTYNGGANNFGTIFKIKPDGSGYIKLLDFAGFTNGWNPGGSLIFDGIYLYGMAMGGITNNQGTIFKIKPDGTNYTDLLDFAGSPDGSFPEGSLISDGTFMYGMTQQGGINGAGTIFKIQPDGSGYVKLFDLADTANGKDPYGSLYFDGTFLYGVTSNGGINNDGVVFKLDTTTMGIEEINKNNSISVYPIPAINNLTVEILQKSTIEILNIQGQTILQQPLQQGKTDIDISGLAKGVYILRLLSNDKIAVTKIVKE
jgi:uncharacterized repeat protein (TIGR03803 family)